MSSFDDHASGSEAQFVQNQAFEFKAAANRNRMMGLWAGEKMGLAGDSLENYAKAVVRVDQDQPSEDDVIRKILGDLVASNLTVRESEVRTKAAEFLAQAREALKGEA